MRKFFASAFQFKFTPLYLLFLCFIAYGVFIPWLGSFSDDLSFIYYYKTLGSAGLQELLETERPFQGYFYSITIPLLGTSPITWQILALLTHWLSAVAVWFMLERLWPNAPRQNAWVASLFSVFPGFISHWMALTWTHLYLMNMFAYGSIGLMLWSFTAKKGRGWLVFLALLSSIPSLIYSEYSYGLEFSRIIFIILFHMQYSKPLKEWMVDIFKKYLPYFLVVVAVLIWRFGIFNSEKYTVELLKLYGNDLSALIGEMVNQTGIGFFKAGIEVWKLIIDGINISLSGISHLLIWGLIIITIIFSAAFFLLAIKKDLSDKPPENQKIKPWWLQAMLLGIPCLIFSIIPFIAAGNHILLDFPENRFMISFAFPSALLMVIALNAFYRTSKTIWTVVFVLILGMSAGRQIKQADTFRKSLLLQRNLFWQLNWRIPSLQPGTLLVTQDLDLDYFSENQLTANLNLLLDPENSDKSQDYALTYTNGRIRNLFENFRADQSLTLCDRKDLCFDGNTSQILVFTYSPASCVSILGGDYSTIHTTLFDFHQQLFNVIPVSKPDLVDPSKRDHQMLSADVFGIEPDHDWCYYYEKADLARQEGNWNEVMTLWDEAVERGFYPKQVNEKFPFLEGLIHTDRLEEAFSLSEEIITSIPWMRTGVCQAWTRASTAVIDPDLRRLSIDDLFTELGCK